MISLRKLSPLRRWTKQPNCSVPSQVSVAAEPVFFTDELTILIIYTKLSRDLSYMIYRRNLQRQNVFNTCIDDNFHYNITFFFFKQIKNFFFFYNIILNDVNVNVCYKLITDPVVLQIMAVVGRYPAIFIFTLAINNYCYSSFITDGMTFLIIKNKRL